MRMECSLDSGDRIQLVGMALLRGLLDEPTLRKALAAEADLLTALQRQGSLDSDDLRDLAQLVEAQQREACPDPLTPDPPTAPASYAEGGDPWASHPWVGDTDSGRQVHRMLSLASWKQYRNLRFVSEGGMGRVFKAFDPSLKRVVALKFLRREDPDLVTRFVLEAQNQAKVEHPNICKVYEVGEWQGQSYIAMQFIKGETLEMAAPTLGLEDRVKVMEAVAEAIHAAHRQGLIHRDLKPANIMVEAEDRGPKPTILDFGLAKGLEATGLTVQGLVIGTTHYMAPEQARGEHDRVGRRTDVYGLGATLHRVLTGQPPFAGTEGVDAVRRTVEEDLPSLTRLVADLPEDLDTIVRRCMEKEPERRYESALAVAEDLRRWREGEPILARRPTYRYLATKWVRRHRLVVAVAAVALGALLATGGYAGWVSWTSTARARYAQRFGQEAERIEALIRYAHLAPRHDIRPELDQARTRMGRLEAEAQHIGALAAGPAAYALGRSQLALGDPEKARHLLEEAWSTGLHTPEVSLALGRALAANYQRALDLARALPSKELREARERELARELRNPALARLREGAPAALESPAYHEALLAFMGGHWDEAQAKARVALGATPWLFEAKRLEGDALLERAKTIPDPPVALATLDAAESCFQVARNLGPSDPATALGEVRVLAERARRELASGRQAEATLARCREAVARARLLRPEGGEAQAFLARAIGAWAELRPPGDSATRAAIDEALHLSKEALAREPENPAVLTLRATLLLIAGRIHWKSGGGPLAQFQEALELAWSAQRRFPQDPTFGSLIAGACMRKMTWEINTGIPPWASFEEGLTQALALRHRFPDLLGCYQGLANLWVERAEFERGHGLDPRPSVAAALEAVAAAEARGLGLANFGWTKGDAHLIRGEYLLAVEGGGEEDFQLARESYRKAYRANPNLKAALAAAAGALIDQAQSRLEHGLDPSALLAEAEAELDRGGDGSSERAHSRYLRGRLALLRGRQRLVSGDSPTTEWGRAEVAFREATRLGEKFAMAHVGRAEVRARAYLRTGNASDALQAVQSAQEALKSDPLRADAWLWIAVVEQERVRRGQGDAEPRAREAWAKALALDANLRRWARELGQP